jgi:fructan beta-fructosidase
MLRTPARHAAGGHRTAAARRVHAARTVSRAILLAAVCLLPASAARAAAAESPTLQGASAMKRDIVIASRYLNMPVKTGAPLRRVKVVIAGEVVREFDIALTDGVPDFWTFLDVSAWKGQTATLQMDGGSPSALAAVRQGDRIEGAEDLYREKDRPQFHFTSRRGWLNDPNGLVFDRGEYHMYYQHNPYGWQSDQKHWGHAVSKDLVHWEELPTAVSPREYGDWVYSGSAVVDHANTSGFQQGGHAPIVIAYTSTGRGECIAYSNDRGRTFTEYAGNPVIRHKGRDPKVIWYPEGRHWVMALYDEKDGDARDVDFYTSPDLKTWTFASRVPGYYECPEFFEMAVDGDPARRKWVLYAADGAYALGAFDGKIFTPDTPKLPANWGNAFYASQTFNDIPARDGRRIRIGWATEDFPGMPFNQMMDFPVELTLRSTPAGTRLFANPVREIEKLHGRRRSVPPGAFGPGENPLADVHGELLDIEADLEPRDAPEITLTARGVPITYDARKQTLTCLDRSAPLPLIAGRLRLRVLVDRASVEIFAGDGLVYMPMAVKPNPDNHDLALAVSSGEARVRALNVFEMKSIWPGDARP